MVWITIRVKPPSKYRDSHPGQRVRIPERRFM
jgi:hypothetical protein